ncbi:NfeD family protein [Actinobacillus succinogenes]|uniref:NfeD-like C-terminal domain-containing protein n=1 Tax=Actinobacillus succinogenes (strain ATCC 55618 / DSM 22257 / CCUG 43843 / 130Z) TaxID=339671 RepID=A6VMX1_ACTSZ|nr:NfeD family protein [Actinobacillus succinogenes]ABR74318.1 protein of unknown function DUF107 [Actinobacillus succinogenes 130Z]PHI39258.1 NfeD family protein [Actinobacillus succinogenes]
MAWLTIWTAWHWLILGFVLLIAEILIPGIFLLWWGLAAIVVAGLMAFITALTLPVLGMIYAILATIFSVLWWKYQHKRDLADEKLSVLNQRNNAMLASRGVVQDIGENGIGRGRFGDTTWRIEGSELTVGDTVEVLAVKGITLIVKKI